MAKSRYLVTITAEVTYDDGWGTVYAPQPSNFSIFDDTNDSYYGPTAPEGAPDGPATVSVERLPDPLVTGWYRDPATKKIYEVWWEGGPVGGTPPARLRYRQVYFPALLGTGEQIKYSMPYTAAETSWGQNFERIDL